MSQPSKVNGINKLKPRENTDGIISLEIKNFKHKLSKQVKCWFLISSFYTSSIAMDIQLWNIGANREKLGLIPHTADVQLFGELNREIQK